MNKKDLQRLERLNRELAALETMRRLNGNSGTVDYSEELACVIEERKAEAIRLLSAIKAMGNPLYRALLIDYYLNRLTVEEMAGKYNYSSSHLYRLKTAAESELLSADV